MKRKPNSKTKIKKAETVQTSIFLMFQPQLKTTGQATKLSELVRMFMVIKPTIL